MRLSLRTASRIAWRETRSSMTKFLFVVLAVAAGVGALAGVRGFSQSFRSTLKDESRTVMAADLTARQFAPATDAQVAKLDDLTRRGVAHTLITETISMASSGTAAPGTDAATPALVSIKAVDPSQYPYYGEVKLDPPMTLKQALTPDTVVVANDILLRLNLKVGDPIRIGTSMMRIAAVVLSEPDRMSGSMNVGLRLIMSREAFERTGLMGFGSRAAYRYLFKTQPTAPPVEQIRADLKAALPDALVADFRESNPIITRGLDRATTFLSLVSLIAMIVGALGVAMAMHAHLQQKMDNIAVMKSLGAASRDIIGIYAIQTLMLGMLGGIAGVLVGKLVEQAFPILIARFFQMDFKTGWNLDAAAQGIAIGVLTTLLFTLPPLLAIRKVRPAMILRRGMPEARPELAYKLAHAHCRRGSRDRIRPHHPGRSGRDRRMARGVAPSRRLLRRRIGRQPDSARTARGRIVALDQNIFEAHAVEDPDTHAARPREFIPPGQSGPRDSRRARIGRDVHAHGLPGAALAGFGDH